MRCCLSSLVTGLAILLVGAAVFFGLAGVLGGQGGDRLATVVAGTGPGRAPLSPTAAGPPPPSGPASRPTLAGPPPGASESQLLRLTEAELTEQLRQRLGGGSDGLTLANPRVRIADGRIQVDAELRGLPVAVPVQASGRAEIRERRPVIILERLDGVGVSLPAAARETIERQLNSLSLLVVPPEVELTRLEIGNGAITLFGRRR